MNIWIYCYSAGIITSCTDSPKPTATVAPEQLGWRTMNRPQNLFVTLLAMISRDTNYEQYTMAMVKWNSSDLLTSYWQSGVWALENHLLQSQTDPKNIQTPHTSFCGFRGAETFTTCWTGSRVQVWVPAGYWPFLPKAGSESNGRFWLQINGQLGTVHRHSFGSVPAQTHCISKLAAVAAGSILLALGRSAAIPSLLTLF